MPGAAATIAVLDMGKTNVKLSACTGDGAVRETLSTPNPSLAGPPWRHHDLAGLGQWVLETLADLCRRHPVGHIIACGHGSGGVLVLADPDAGGDGAALPMIDYEQPLPPGLDAAYAPLSGSYFDRGSAVMMAATHQARQLFWMQGAEPAAFARARWYLGVPQYWGWWLSGVAVSECSLLGAQSHLWNVPERRWAPIVGSQGWTGLMPPIAPASATLGPIRPALTVRFGLPAGILVHVGAHDSFANFYRYQAAGLSDLMVVSTGTWFVALADRIPLARLIETCGMTCNSDLDGQPLGGALTMGGREFAAVAGDQLPGALADPARIARLVANGTMALPSFGENDGQFPDSARQGRTTGPAPENAPDRLALAVLYSALLTVACIDRLDPDRPVVLDGSALRDPAFAGLVAALRPGRQTRHNPESYGVAAGAALICSHASRTAPAPISLCTPDLPPIPGLAAYASRWRSLAETTLTASSQGPHS